MTAILNVSDCLNTGANDTQCAEWAQLGFCSSNYGWMLINCQKSCNLCTDNIYKLSRFSVECHDLRIMFIRATGCHEANYRSLSGGTTCPRDMCDIFNNCF